MNAFESYKAYLAIKQHFHQRSYDYFKYGGKVSVKQQTFESRRDKYLFQKLSKKKDVEGFLIANFVEKDTSWIRDMLCEEGEAIYNQWLKRQQSITYLFESDLEKLDNNINKNLIVENEQHPLLLKLIFQKEIMLETSIIIDDIIGVFSYWNKSIKETIIWPDLYHKIIKYKPFVKYDKVKCKMILKNRFIV